MRCVSYTRSISGSYEKINAAASIPDLRVLEPCKNITDQNLEIAEYMKQKRWTVSKKYSDRRQDGSEVSSFNRLIADGIDRNYDLVVIWSMFFFGEDVQAAVDLLLDIFYPAGIQFAVVEDDFCSLDHDEQEVVRYLKDCRHKYKSMLASMFCSRYNEGKRYKFYGYIWNPDETLEEDPESVKVIKAMYAMALDGMNSRKIAERLNAEGVETTVQYRNRKMGKEQKTKTTKDFAWTTSTVRYVLKNEMYTGKWIRPTMWQTVEMKCPVIIGREDYDKIQRQFFSHRRKGAVLPRQKTHSYFTGILFDQFTGEKFFPDRKLIGGTEIYRLRSEKNALVTEKGHYLQEEVLICRLFEQLDQIHREAEQTLKYIRSISGRQRKVQLQSVCQQRMQQLFAEMINLEKRLKENNAAAEHALRLLEEEMEEQEELIDYYEKLFGESNPWLELYLHYQKPEKVTPEFFRKYCSKILSEHFCRIHLEEHMAEWKISIDIPGKLDQREVIGSGKEKQKESANLAAGHSSAGGSGTGKNADSIVCPAFCRERNDREHTDASCNDQSIYQGEFGA